MEAIFIISGFTLIIVYLMIMFDDGDHGED